MSRVGYQRMRAEVAAGVWRSGWCGEGNPPASHARCVEHPRPDGRKCRCVCHQKAAVEGDLTGLHTDMSNADYHAQTDWLSSTQLKAALPEHYKTGGSQEALDFGTLVHTVVLEPDNADHYLPVDPYEVGVKKDGSRASVPTNTDAWKDFAAQAEADGKSVISHEWWESALRMREALLGHSEARELLFSDDGRSEVSAFATDADGIRHKARFDRLIPGHGVDLKTTMAQPGEHHLTSTVMTYGYQLSAAHYLTVAELLDLKIDNLTLVFVSKVEPYRVTVCDLDALLIGHGHRLRALALDRLHGQAEPYEGATGRLILTCPFWALPDDIEVEIS